jgi:hypothetical protein
MKTNSISIYSAALACALALVSCMKGGETPENPEAQGPAVSFNTAIDGGKTSTSLTRTTDGGDAWVAGDDVGVYMITAGGTIPESVIGPAANILYNVGGADPWPLSVETPAEAIQFPVAGSVDFVAYYPWSATGGGKVGADGKYTVTLTDQSNSAAIDVLRAKTASPILAASVAPVTLRFYHMLSKFTINIKAGANVDAEDVAAIAADGVVLSWIPVATTIDLDDASSAPGANGSITLVKAATATEDFDATFTAIIAPHAGRAGRQLAVRFGSQTLSWTIPMADAYTYGNNYSYSGTIDDRGLVVSESSIVPWTPTPKSEMTRDGQIDRITWDAATGRYALTTDPTDAGLFFKFGSVVGIYTANGAVQTLPPAAGTDTDTFDAGDIAWNPTDVTTWATVPVYGATDFALATNTVTPPLYHNIANVKAGKGDPCRLVGLDLAKIKATAAGDLANADIDNGTWRLPTNDENKLFSGYEATTPNTTANYYTTHDGSAIGSPAGVIGGMFPNTTTGSLATFLPFTGNRNMNAGTLNSQLTDGYYWTSIPGSTTDGGIIYFNANNVNPARDIQYSYGFSVRCVRQ